MFAWTSCHDLVAARVLATYFIPGCVGRGVRLGSENSSGGAGGGGAWAQAWAQVGGPTWGPSGWAHVGPTHEKIGGRFLKICFTHEKNGGKFLKICFIHEKNGGKFLKIFVTHEKKGGKFQKPAKPATDISHNGRQKIHLVQKPFRLLFPAAISLKPF